MHSHTHTCMHIYTCHMHTHTHPPPPPPPPLPRPLPDVILELFSLYSGVTRDFATDIPAQCQVRVEVDPREHFMRAALK